MSRDLATSVARNATVLMASQIVTWGSSFVLMIFLPRYLGTEDYGRLFLAMSVTMIAQVFVDFGGAYFIAKEIARHRDRAPQLIADSIGFRLGLSAISFTVLVFFAWIAGYPWEVQALIGILAAAKFWEGPLGVLISAFQGFEEMVHRSFVAIAERVLLTVAGVSALLLGATSLEIAIIMAISTLIGCFVGFRRLRLFVEKLPRVIWRNIPGLFRSGLPYLMMAIFAIIYYRINAVMLSFLAPETVVGWFGAAFRFFDILMFFPSIMSMAVFPVLSRQAGQKDSVVPMTAKSLEIILLGGVPVAIATYAFAGDIIALLFGLDGYSGSVVILKALVPGLLLVYVDFVLVTSIIAMDRQRTWSIVALTAIPLSVGLNYVLIPLFQREAGNGGIGSAIATNITEFGILCCALMLLPRGFFPRSFWKQPAKTFVAGGAMAAVIWALQGTGLPWMLTAACSIIVFAGSVLLTGAIHPDERRFIVSTLAPSSVRRMFVPQKSGA